jgi:hypothetical protein
MQLRTARLCLDCEEVHGDWRCPVCASGSFTYLTRWIPVEDRRHSPLPRPAEPTPTAPAANNGSRWVKRGALGVAVVAASRFLWHVSRPVDRASAPRPDQHD